MSKKNIIIFSMVGILSILPIIIIYIVFSNSNNSNQNNQQNSNNNLETINNFSSQQSNQFTNNSEVVSSPYIIPLSLLYKLKINENNPNMSYYYSSQNKIAFTYEIKSIDNKKNISVTEGHPDIGDEEKVYLFFTEKDNIQSGQSIEVINVDPNFRFNTIPEIIIQQILIADEKQGCRIEEKNGRYTIKPKTNTQTCGNYVGGNNRFFVKPTEDGSAISKLIFVNSGSQELSYDGSMKGKYWYESVIVE
jgi:hypothetical protein